LRRGRSVEGGVLQRTYQWMMSLAGRRRAPWALAAVAFAESSFFPVPPDAMLVPMVLARPDRAWVLAGACTAASVVGGFFGYAIGYFLYETLGRFLIDLYGYESKFESFRDAYNRWGVWIILIKGMTPIPYKLVTIASGVARFDLALFAAASLVTRGARFYLVALLLRRYGEPIRGFIERYLTLVTTGMVLIIVAGFALVRYL
jgi:membrane protein YqaA with SNARE-associated domain